MAKKKDDIDIDFDEWLHDPPSITDEELERLTRPEIKPLDIMATIRYGNEYLSKDLAFLTSQQMVDWIIQVFPVAQKDKLFPADFEGRTARQQTYDQILKFYSQPIFPVPESLVKKDK
jgi:hypothetical protein